MGSDTHAPAAPDATSPDTTGPDTTRPDATSPDLAAAGPDLAVTRLNVAACTQIIPFWHIDTTAGAAAEIRVRAAPEADAAFSPWVSLARWSSHGDSTSLPAQPVRGLRVDTDTITVIPDELGGPARVVELAVRAVPATASGTAGIAVHRLEALTRTAAPPRAEVTASPARGQDIELRLPEICQHTCGTLDGFGLADSWCSPTALTMVMDWLTGGGVESATAAGSLAVGSESAAQRVQRTVRGVWDRAYGGAGNWAFNVAWANSCGFDARLDSLANMREAEQLLAAGEVLIASVSFSRAQLPEAGYGTAGHLLVISGVTAAGDVRVHDPGRAIGDGVRAVYPREAFEQAWLSAEGSGGLVYRVRRA